MLFYLLFYNKTKYVLKRKLILLIQICNRAIDPIYKLLKTIKDEIIVKLIA